MNFLKFATLLFFFFNSSLLHAQSDAQKQFEKDAKEVTKTSERLADEKKKEEMRDKSHDGRIPVGNNTSVSGDKKPDKVEVNVKKTY